MKAVEIANLKILFLYWCFKFEKGLKLQNRNVLVGHCREGALQKSFETLAVVANYHYEELLDAVCYTWPIAFVVDIHVKSDRSAKKQNRVTEN